MDTFLQLISRLHEAGARFVLIGVWGANYYATSGSTLFTTLDRDLFLPSDPANLLVIWRTCQSLDLRLTTDSEPLGDPLDRFLADQMIERKALTKATNDKGLEVDLSLVMTGFDFEDAWEHRRIFRVANVEIPVVRLTHIVTSKARTNRPKVRLFLETHAEVLRELMEKD